MKKIKPRTLSGFMELMPQNQVYFNEMAQRLRESFSLYGFTPLDTPLMEAAEILLAKGGGETEKQVYRLTKGDTDLAVRYELTASLAKYVALHQGSLTFPFRRYEIGKVMRGERAQRGRFREFYQADIDIIGDGKLDIINEAEIPSVIYRSMTALGLRRFVIHVNNRKVLNGFFEILEISNATEAMRAVDKIEKIGEQKLTEHLTTDVGLTHVQSAELIALVTHQGDPFEALDKYRGRNETFDIGMDELSAVARYMSAFGVPDTHFKIDISIARGLDYYTGTVYETFLEDHPEVGSICSGGRYDELAEYYTDRKFPGVGISIGLSRLFYILQEQQMLNPAVLSAPADVLIIPMTEDLSHPISLATQMREAGLRVQLYSEDKKFKSKVAYADKLGIPYVAFLGEDEIKSGQVTVKDMRSGEQTQASAGLIIAGLAEKIKIQRNAPPIAETK
ncbi:MAG: histidine--tRNA ligase [Oscillospiraceae bacterium]|nr:histidine--tRNA ligase [Oscillospiraceae bacterium]